MHPSDITPYQPLTLLSSPIAYSGLLLAAPWSLMAETDHLVVTCSLGSKYNLGLTLPNNLLSAFKNGEGSHQLICCPSNFLLTTGIRNLTFQACNISGSLPDTAWSSVFPLTARLPYVNLYPVYIDMSKNAISGNLPDSYLSTSWIDCWVTRLDLSSNKLQASIGYDAASNLCDINYDQGQVDVCSYFKSTEYSIPLFSRGVVYGSGPYSNTSLGTCGLVTSRLGYSGMSWMTGSASSFNSRMFVYSWKFSFPANSPYADCTLDNSCDLTSTSFEVTNVYTAHIPYSLILNGNSVSLLFSNWATRSLSLATFGMPTCDKTIQFGDRTQNLCARFTPFPIIYIVWGLVGSATIICYLIGWWFGRKVNVSAAKVIPETPTSPKKEALEDKPEAMVVESISEKDLRSSTLDRAKSLSNEDSHIDSRLSPQSRALRNVTSIQVRQAVASTGAALFMDQDDSAEEIVKATTQRGDWLARHQFRIKFIIQTLIALYVFIWTILLISQMSAQAKLCAATTLCSTVMFPLGITAFVAPGFVVCFLIVACSIRNRARNFLIRRRPGLSRTLRFFILVLIFIATIPISLLGGILLGGPVWLFLFVGWFIGRFSRWVDRKMWPIMCLLSTVAALVTNIPLAVLVTWLFFDGYDISAKNGESNSLLFLANMVGHAFAFCTFALSIHMRRDIWSTLYRLLTGDPSLPPWHVYPEQVRAEKYATAFPKRPRKAIEMSTSQTALVSNDEPES